MSVADRRRVHLSRPWALLALLAVLACAPGCLKMQMHWQLYPDGSGKVKMRAVVRPPMLPGLDGKQDPKEMEKRLRSANPFKDFAGITVKPGSARSDVHEGTLRFYAEGYFTDVNQVTRKGQPVLRFAKLDEGGYEAHYLESEEMGRIAPGGRDEPLPGSDGVEDAAGKAGDGKKPPASNPGKEMEAMMKAMMKGLEVKLFLEMPANLTRTNVAKRNDRTAVLKITDQVLDDPAEQARIEKLDGVRAQCGELTPEQGAEFEAFRKELAQVLAEAEAAAAAAAAGKEENGGKGGDFPDEDK